MRAGLYLHGAGRVSVATRGGGGSRASCKTIWPVHMIAGGRWGTRGLIKAGGSPDDVGLARTLVRGQRKEAGDIP